MIESVTKFADPYDRQARLYPALLVLAPVVLVLLCFYAPHASMLTNAALVLIACGVLFWLANLARDCGKKQEAKLFSKWGGKPSTQLLRHRDNTIDPVTKQRYHAVLSDGMRIAFPTAEEERDQPDRADHLYESATRWMLEQTRDSSRFSLLLSENIAYGFRRNMLGVKYIGVFVAASACGWAVIRSITVLPAQSPSFALQVLDLPAQNAIAIAGCLLLVFMWVVGTTKDRVQTAAFAYATRLLSACDQFTKNG